MNASFEDHVELVSSPWAAKFYGLVNLAQHNLLIAAPYISNAPIRRVVEIVKETKPASVNIVTNLAVDSLLSGSLDVASLLYLLQSIPTSNITYLPGLHAKIFVADDKAAVVTSGNLTNGCTAPLK
jgi:hypothetical protein